MQQGDFKQAHQIALKLLQQTATPYTPAWTLAHKLAHVAESTNQRQQQQQQLQYWKGNARARMQLVCWLSVTFPSVV